MRRGDDPEEERRVIQESIRVFSSKISRSKISVSGVSGKAAEGRLSPRPSPIGTGLRAHVSGDRPISPRPGVGQVTTPGLGPRKLNQPNRVVRSGSVPFPKPSATSRWKSGVEKMRAKSASIK